MSVDLEKSSFAELVQLQKDIAILIKKREKEEKIALRKKMEALAEESGFTFDDIAAETKATKKSKVKPKYANPDNPEQTWTGRGRRPKWIVSALNSGMRVDDLLI